MHQQEDKPGLDDVVIIYLSTFPTRNGFPECPAHFLPQRGFPFWLAAVLKSAIYGLRIRSGLGGGVPPEGKVKTRTEQGLMRDCQMIVASTAMLEGRGGVRGESVFCLVLPEPPQLPPWCLETAQATGWPSFSLQQIPMLLLRVV